MNPRRLLIMLLVGLVVGGACCVKIWHDKAVVRWRSACINNLHWMAGAKELLARERGLKPGTAVDEQTAGGKYSVNPVGKDPTCSISGHSLTQ